MTTDADILFRQILDNPDDDTLRLVYADAIEEAGEGDRAAFVRVQVELKDHGPRAAGRLYHEQQVACHKPCVPNCKFCRESALLAKHPEWRPTCPVCDGKKMVVVGNRAGVEGVNRCERICLHCSGSGRVGTLHRGLLESVEVPTLATVFEWPSEGEVAAIGDGGPRPTPWARGELVAKFPTVQRVVCKDQIPWVYNDPDSPREYGWWDDAGTDTPEDGVVPTVIFDAMWKEWVASRQQDERGRWMLWDHRDDAIDAHAEALCGVLKEMCR